jgi:magnesium-transporting ATPase (P-type)
MNHTAPYQLPVDEVLATLDTDGRRGLSQDEARARLASYGRNELTAEKPAPWWKKFLAQFQDVLVILLLIATAISAGLWLYERESALPYEAMAIFGALLADVIGLAPESGGLALPLLATQILWINLVTDGAPALALGVDPADEGVMQKPPRPRGEGVITRRMWTGIFFVGAIMAAGTLLVLDASLPGGLIEGFGDMRYAHTMAFTTLVLFSLFTVFNARSDEQSAFAGMFSNKWLWGAVLLSLLLQVAVIYIPFLQQAFSTVSLSLDDWLRCAAVASSVLWLSELSKIVTRATGRKTN